MYFVFYLNNVESILCIIFISMKFTCFRFDPKIYYTKINGIFNGPMYYLLLKIKNILSSETLY